jgi:hypothetical protein
MSVTVIQVKVSLLSRGSFRGEFNLHTYAYSTAYLLTLPLCVGDSRIRALSPAWTGSPAHTFSSHTISSQQKICLLSSVAIFVYNQSAISVNRRDVSYQFLLSFSRLFVQEYETDCCLCNRTDNNTN